MLETGRFPTFRLAMGILMVMPPLFTFTPGISRAQVVGNVELESHPSPVHLGQIMELGIRIRTQADWAVEAPDSLPGLRDFRQIGPARVTRSVQNPDQVSWHVTYPLVPLRAGFRPLPALTLALRRSEGGDDRAGASSQTLRVPLNGVSVQSVLPPPGQAVSPAPPRFPTKPEEAGSAFLLWAAVGALLTGSGWFYVRNRARNGPREQWGTNDDRPEDGEAPDLADQLFQVLQEEPTTEAQREKVFDRSVLLVRQILESRSPKSLTAYTTSDLVEYLRNGSGLLNANTLERALVAGDDVRFRKSPPSEQDLVDFREGIWAWVELEKPEVGRKRAREKNV